jgi:hypothetical protein
MRKPARPISPAASPPARRRFPAPATVIALIALIVSIGGGAYAASTIQTRDIGNGAVTRKKLAKHAVNSQRLARKAVGTGRLKADAATGAKVNEATLGEVPSAARAEHANQASSADQATNADAVGGMTVQKFSATPAPNTPLARIATAGTLDLEVGCASNGNPLFRIAAASGAPAQGVRGSFDDGSTKSNTVAAGTLGRSGQLDVLDGNTASASGDINAATADGQVTTIHWAARSAVLLVPGGGNPEPDKCFFYGTAVSG